MKGRIRPSKRYQAKIIRKSRSKLMTYPRGGFYK